MSRLAVPAKIPRVSVYLDQSIKERLEMAANAERRSASQMAAILIEEALAAREKQQDQNKRGPIAND